MSLRNLRLLGGVDRNIHDMIDRTVDAYCLRPPRWVASQGKMLASDQLPNLGRVLKAYLKFRATGQGSSLTEADYKQLIRLLFQFLVERELAFDIERLDADFVCSVTKYLDQNLLIWSVDDVLKTIPWARPDYTDWVISWQHGLFQCLPEHHFTHHDIVTRASLVTIVWLAKRSVWRRRRVDAVTDTSNRPN